MSLKKEKNLNYCKVMGLTAKNNDLNHINNDMESFIFSIFILLIKCYNSVRE